MRLVSFELAGFESIGVVRGDSVVDIRRVWPAGPEDMLEALWLGDACLRKIEAIAAAAGPEDQVALSAVRPRAPVPRPGKVLALAGNYAEHIKEAAHERGFALGLSDSPRRETTPRPFLMPGTAVIGDGDEIPLPAYSRQVDYELELAVVMGRRCKCVEAAEAAAYIAGYTVANDVSARGVTYKAGRKERPWDEFYDWLNGKWADGFCPMGPVLVTADEVADVQALGMELRVNGQVRQKADTGRMIYDVAEIIAFLSRLMTLEPGDVICTGTPSGVGVATGRFLQPGDVIEAEIDGIGTLTNRVGPAPDEYYEPLASR